MKYVFTLLFLTASLLAQPIIFNTLPKSGSVFICHSLAHGLKGGQESILQITDTNFPESVIDPYLFHKLLNIDGITQAHFDPSPRNLALLKSLCPKLIIHVRDPRQSLVSWIHHLNQHKDSPEILRRFLVPLPTGYFDYSFTQQIEWQIKNYLPLCIHWIQKWIEVSEEDKDLEILFTTYENFITDRQGFFEEILDYYHYDLSKNTIPALCEKPGTRHIRKGQIDEWMGVMTTEQKLCATEMIPREFFARFNWTP